MLDWQGALNVRDLGGLPTQDGRRTRRGAIARSAGLSTLTDAGHTSLIGHGVVSVVDIRRPGEVEVSPDPVATLQSSSTAYDNVPFEQPPDALSTEATAESVASGELLLSEMYVKMLDGFQPGVVSVMVHIAQASPGGVLVHCAGGRDRTGLVCALLLDLVGVVRSQIAADYEASREALRPLMEEWVARSGIDPDERERVVNRFDTTSEALKSTLEHIDGVYGGAEAYLRHAGVGAGQIRRLRQRLLPVAADSG